MDSVGDILLKSNIRRLNRSYKHFEDSIKVILRWNLHHQHVDAFALLQETNPKLFDKYCIRYSITNSTTDIAILKNKMHYYQKINRNKKI